MVAPVLRVMLVSARMSPTNEVAVPSVAELPTAKNTFRPRAPPVSEMLDALAVVRVLPMLKMNAAIAPSVKRQGTCQLS
jgi:hypothetical protein